MGGGSTELPVCRFVGIRVLDAPQARKEGGSLDGAFAGDATADGRPYGERFPRISCRRPWLGVAGARLPLAGARRRALARLAGVSELIIGLTIVAAGTSLRSRYAILAAMKGQRDIAVGNIVGSNIFNILAILGLSRMLAPEPIAVSPAALRFDIPIMIAVALACLPVFFTGRQIARWEGALFSGVLRGLRGPPGPAGHG